MTTTVANIPAGEAVPPAARGDARGAARGLRGLRVGGQEVRRREIKEPEKGGYGAANLYVWF